MTTEDRATRLAEIAERGRDSSTMHTFDQVAVYARTLEDDRTWMLADITQSDTRAKEMAGLLQETLEFVAMFIAYDGRDRGTVRMDSTLDGLGKIARRLDSRLRSAADHAAKDKTDG